MGAAAKAAGTVLLLCASNTFMNTAWYLHLKFKAWPMVLAIFASWGIAFAEYCLAVPANRIGHTSQGGPFSASQLKVIQEGISLSTFAIFSVLVLKEKLRWIDAVSFGLIFAGVAVSLAKPAVKTVEAPAPEVALAPAAEGAAAAGAPAPAAELVVGRRMLELVQQGQQEQLKPGGVEQQSGLLRVANILSSSATEHSEQRLLRTDDSELRREGSAAVLVASGYSGVPDRGSQQGVHSRGHTQEPETAPDEERPASRSGQQ